MAKTKPLAGPDLLPWRGYAGPIPQIKQERYVPSGYRQLALPLAYTEKGVRVRYFDYLIWVPANAIRQDKDGRYWAPIWAVDSAKESESVLYQPSDEHKELNRQQVHPCPPSASPTPPEAPTPKTPAPFSVSPPWVNTSTTSKT